MDLIGAHSDLLGGLCNHSIGRLLAIISLTVAI